MRKKMVQLVTVLLAVGFLSQCAFAGGIDNKTNWSAKYIGSTSRNAAIDGADAAAYNPAGIMQMENGIYAELDTQVLFLDYDHVFNGQSHDISEMPIVPSLFVIHKLDKWALYGTFTINGGGGEVNYEQGNIITEKIGRVAAAGGFTPGAYASYEAATGTVRPNASILLPAGTLSNQFASVESVYYTFTAGTAYAVNDIVSISAAARYMFTKKEVDIHGTYTDAAGFGGAVTNVLGKYDQDAKGVGFVVGMNIRPQENLNFALTYQTKVNLDWDTDINSATKGTVAENILWMNGKVDGQEEARDLPAVFSAGLVWNITPQLSISPSYTVYFEENADWGTQNSHVSGNSYDYALSLGYAFNDKLSATIGYMYTDIDMSPDDYSLTEQMSPPLDAHTVSIGSTYKFNEKISVSTGLMGIFYVDEKAATTYLPAGLGGGVASPEVEYQKTNYVAAISLQYKF